MSTPNGQSAGSQPHMSLEESQRCKAVETRLAHIFGMDSDPQRIDSEAVLEEARRRATGTKRPRTLFRLGKARESVTQNDVEDLEKLKRFRTQSNQPLRSAIPYHALRFWAVLIGIDAYQSNPLQGCVSDALKMKELLTEKFEVPEHRIQCLLGSTDSTPGSSIIPSRANIVNVLYDLIDNDEIQRGDNIIIYYAGHGSSYRCSPQCTHKSTYRKACSACPVEAMCPIDRDIMDPSDSRRWIPDISDRELNALFTQISCTKGHKITFLADCCYAGGMSRDPYPPTGKRAIAPTLYSTVDDMLRAAHTRLQHLPCYRSVLSPDWQADMSSHVLVAACQDYQTARESGGGGDSCGGEFTRSLVNILASGEFNQGTTYQGLVDLLNQSYAQTPYVSGDHKQEPLWYLDSGIGS
ncbi:caspase domain-containing protein [Armillaria fumosa]|nr:caspase domain-containing protein [Armillaria fumosa]